MSIDRQNLNEQVRDLQPPSARDRQIFEAVVVQQRGQCEVAAEQGISQPRISQIVAAVGAWLNRALPRGRQNEDAAGEMAVASYVVEAQLDFLLQQTMQDIAESRKEKVTEKAGMRGEMRWTETKTVKRPIVPVGLLNMAARLSLAKAKLAGVDVSGRTQREAVLAEVRGQGTVVRSQGTEITRQKSGVSGQGGREARGERSLIKKSAEFDVAAENVQPQVEAAQEDKLLRERDEFIKNRACEQLINHLRRDPECAGWTEKQLQEHVQLIWDMEQQEREPHPGPLAKGDGEESGVHSPRDILPVPQAAANGRKEPRHRQKEWQSPQQRRREFLAPLAVG